MIRRGALLLGAAAVLAAMAMPATAVAAGKPNIVLITTDDQTLASYTPQVMPNTTRLLGGKGTTFTNAIATTPQCCPSRASIITGQYAHNHGVRSNRLAYAALADKGNTLPVWLDRAGYETVHIGKYLNGYESAVGTPTEVAPGWNRWYTTLGSTRYYNYDVSANNKLVHFRDGDDEYVTRVITRKATDLIERTVPHKAPLYLQVDQRAPHTETLTDSGGRCGGRAVPDQRDKQLFRDLPLPQTPSFNEVDIADKPAFIRTRLPIDVARIKKMTKRYTCSLASLRGVDRSVKKIFEAVKKAGELDNTVFAFMSDNGFFDGQHRIGVGKIYPYEEGIRVPLVIRMPAKFRGGAPLVPQAGAPVANIDLAPTFLELAGGSPCSAPGACRTMDGRSLVALMNGRASAFPSQRALVAEFAVGNSISQEDGLCEYSGVRVPGAIYIESIMAAASGACEPDPALELYDLTNDPFQLSNAAVREPGIGSLQARLSRRLDGLRDCAGLAGRDAQLPGQPYCE
jgi:arylsulfatase A-like enzyme